MSERKVLLLTYHFPPSAAAAVHRMLGLVRFLPRFGWQPIVVAPPRIHYEPEDASLLDQVPPGTPVVRVPLGGKLLRYLAPSGHWLPRAWRACRQIVREQRPEAVITSSPPGCIHYLGLGLQARYGLPWLTCFRDPWVANFHERSSALFDRLGERLVVRRASCIVANTPLGMEGLRRAYPEQADKIVTITNGFDPPELPAPAAPRGETLTLLHAGELYHGRDPRGLLDALAQRREEQRLVFVGRQTEAQYDLAAEVRRRGLEAHVELAGQVSYAEALARMRQADILLLLHRPGFLISVPAKLYEYLRAGRPVLALAEPDSDIGWVLRQSSVLHRIAAPHDGAGIRRALAELVAEVRRGAPVVADPRALECFTREHMARLFARCLDACASPSPEFADPALVPAVLP